MVDKKLCLFLHVFKSFLFLFFGIRYGTQGHPTRVAAVCSMASGGVVPTDDEQATGLEREVLMATRKGLDPYNISSGTKEDPKLVPSITHKRNIGCICEEDNNAVIWFLLHKGETQRCPNCGTHYKAGSPPVSRHRLSHISSPET
uniref:Cytochrome c oxidase subunit 5B, mitochondrial n=1 Tax=Marmota marmota marmota TaxID=9994 RepID=A0A8C5ZW25_MARMA